jgi:site-specific DNA-methyltransferase (adenine-specific)
MELWTLCRKPLSEKTVASNVLKYGTGGLNIDGGRIGTEETITHGGRLNPSAGDTRTGKALGMYQAGTPNLDKKNPAGRFPANVILDEDAARLLDEQSGESKSSPVGFKGIGWKHSGNTSDEMTSLEYQNKFNDSGGASRFFYTAKASKSERNRGCEDNEYQRHADPIKDDGAGGDNPRNRTNTPKQNYHPTVKPLSLMQYLCKLITPPDGIVLEPFLGSGTTAIACYHEGFGCIGFEIDKDYYEIAVNRLEEHKKQGRLFDATVMVR